LPFREQDQVLAAAAIVNSSATPRSPRNLSRRSPLVALELAKEAFNAPSKAT